MLKTWQVDLPNFFLVLSSEWFVQERAKQYTRRILSLEDTEILSTFS